MAITPDDFGRIVLYEMKKHIGLRYIQNSERDKLYPGLQSSLTKRREETPAKDLMLGDGFTVIGGNIHLVESSVKGYSELDRIPVAVEYHLIPEFNTLDQRSIFSESRPYGVLTYDVRSLEWVSAIAQFDLKCEDVSNVIVTISGAKIVPFLQDMEGMTLQKGIEYFFKTVCDSRKNISPNP